MLSGRSSGEAAPVDEERAGAGVGATEASSLLPGPQRPRQPQDPQAQHSLTQGIQPQPQPQPRGFGSLEDGGARSNGSSGSELVSQRAAAVAARLGAQPSHPLLLELPKDEERARIKDIKGFFVVCFVVLLGDTARGIMFPTLWPRVVSLGGDKVIQGICVASFSLGRVISSPILGSISQAHGYRSVLLACNIVILAGALTYAMATSLPLLIAAQIVLGLGSGSLGVTRSYVAELTGKRRRTELLAYLTAVQYAGFTVMPLAGAGLAVLGDSLPPRVSTAGPLPLTAFTLPALTMAVLAVLALLLLLLVFKDPPRTPAAEESSTHSRPGTPAPAADELLTGPPEGGCVRCGSWTKHDGVVLGGLLLNVTTKGTIAMYETLGSEYAIETYGWDPAKAGVAFSAFGAMGVMALLSFRGLVKRFNDVQLVLGGVLVMAGCCLLLVHLGGEAIALWRFLLSVGVMYSSAYPIGHTAVLGLFSKIVGKGPQGAMLGWFGSAGSLARIIFPLLAGTMSHFLGDSSICKCRGAVGDWAVQPCAPGSLGSDLGPPQSLLAPSC